MLALADMQLLRCLPPTMEPKATDYVQQMINTIKQIIKNGACGGWRVEPAIYLLYAVLCCAEVLITRGAESNAVSRPLSLSLSIRTLTLTFH